jgi:IS30 family transposase
MLTYHVTIQRELIRTQTQTITVEATDATSAYALAETKLDNNNWDTDPREVIGEVYEVECNCEDGGWKHNFITPKPSPTTKPKEPKL